MQMRSWMIISVLAAVAAGIGAAALLGMREPIALRSGTALAEPRAIADFELIDQRNRAFDRQALAGHWSLVFAGFTNCPDICPTTLTLFATLSKRLRRDDLQLVFVSVDPERDTPERIAGYLAYFDPELVGATGTGAQLENFTGQLGLAFVRNPGAGGEYTMDHSTALVLIDPKVRVAAYFQPPHDPDALVADLSALMGGAG